MSLINFLNPKLKPSVYCEAVCEDGFGVANLIADEEEQLNRGFIGFPPVLPPVEIIFDFPKKIDLKVIKLWNGYRNLRSTAFEIHSKYEGIWERVGFVRDLDKLDSVTFCYQSDYNSRSKENTCGEQSEKAFFFKTAYKILSNTSSIKIIIRSTNKCPPILRKVQIWGLPSRSLEKADRELVKTIWNEITNPYDQSNKKELHNSGHRSPSRSLPELNENSTLKIPEEFLDSITWELMIFPTVLPSGKVVDQSTIDKHSEVESKWGRMPSDPFTGLEFTSQRKAILNLALKARIEKFLMENAEHFKTVPRCLGSSRVRRSKNRHASQFANLLCHSHCATTDSSVGTCSSLLSRPNLQKSIKSSSSSTTTSLSLLPQVRSSSSSDLMQAPKRIKTADTSTYAPIELFHSTATKTSATATTSSSENGLMVAGGIDDAIKLALQKITRYTHLPNAETESMSCISCKSDQYIYEIQTCKHVVCRKCIIQLAKEEICKCNTSFTTADIERYHKL